MTKGRAAAPPYSGCIIGVSTSMKPRSSSCRRSDAITLARVTKALANVGIRDQIEVALAVARLDVFEAMPLLRHGKQRLREEVEPVDVDAELAGPGAEQIALRADDVAEIEQLPELIILLRHGVLLDVDLELLAVLHQMRESGLAHAAYGLNPAADLYADSRLEFFGGLGRRDPPGFAGWCG